MATYYWLGRQASSGSGNVNIAFNWTTIGPSGAGGVIPPSGTSIPGNGDNIVFTRFIGPTGTWPLYSPGGTLGTGVSGSTAFIGNMDIFPDCPVSVGIYNKPGFANEQFVVNCYNRISITNNNDTPSNIGDHFIRVNDNKIGATPAVYDPQVTVYLYREPNDYGQGQVVRLSGVASHLTVGNDQLTSNGTVYLNNMTLSSNSVLPSSFYKSLNTQGYSKDMVYISESTKIQTAGIGGNSKVYISPGFGSTGTISIAGNALLSLPRIPTLEFVAGACGGISYGVPQITKLNKLEMIGGGLLSPFVNVYHGVGISFLDQRGGVLNFNVPPGTTQIMCSVYEGRFIVQGQNASELKSEWPTVRLGEGSLGSGGDFVVVNTADPGLGYVPRIKMKGIYDVEINPANEGFF